MISLKVRNIGFPQFSMWTPSHLHDKKCFFPELTSSNVSLWWKSGAEQTINDIHRHEPWIRVCAANLQWYWNRSGHRCPCRHWVIFARRSEQVVHDALPRIYMIWRNGVRLINIWPLPTGHWNGAFCPFTDESIDPFEVHLPRTYSCREIWGAHMQPVHGQKKCGRWIPRMDGYILNNL